MDLLLRALSCTRGGGGGGGRTLYCYQGTSLTTANTPKPNHTDAQHQQTSHSPSASRVDYLRSRFRSKELTEDATKLLLSSWRQKKQKKTRKSHDSLFSKWLCWCHQRDTDPISGNIAEVFRNLGCVHCNFPMGENRELTINYLTPNSVTLSALTRPSRSAYLSGLSLEHCTNRVQKVPPPMAHNLGKTVKAKLTNIRVFFFQDFSITRTCACSGNTPGLHVYVEMTKARRNADNQSYLFIALITTS